jgi:hypothetical protein
MIPAVPMLFHFWLGCTGAEPQILTARIMAQLAPRCEQLSKLPSQHQCQLEFEKERGKLATSDLVEAIKKLCAGEVSTFVFKKDSFQQALRLHALHTVDPPRAVSPAIPCDWADVGPKYDKEFRGLPDASTTDSVRRGILPSSIDAAVVGSGIAQFLEKRARIEVESYMREQLTNGLCKNTGGTPAVPSAFKRFLPSTCGLLLADDPKHGFFSPWAAIREALVDDAWAAPQNVVEGAVASEEKCTRSGAVAQLLLAGFAELRHSTDFDVVLGRLDDRVAASSTTSSFKALELPLAVLRLMVVFERKSTGTMVQEAMLETVLNASETNTAKTPSPADASPGVRPFIREMTRVLGSIRESADTAALAETPSDARAQQLLASMGYALRALELTVNLTLVKDQELTRNQVLLLFRHGRTLIDALSSQNLPMVAVGILGLLDESQQSSILPGGLVSVLSLAGSLQRAQTEDEVSDAIEAFAAPAGSWRSKAVQEGFFLNGFFGVAAGGDFPLGAAAETLHTRAATPLHASVGIDWVTHFFCGCVSGLYLPVLNVTNLLPSLAGSEDRQEQVSWRSLVSPGLYARWSIPDTPFVVAAGGNVRFQAYEEVDDPVPVFRFELMAAVDVTIFRLK